MEEISHFKKKLFDKSYCLFFKDIEEKLNKLKENHSYYELLFPFLTLRFKID